MLNYILYRLGQFIALTLPLKIGYRLAVFCSDVHYIFADKDRQAVKENLKTIFPKASEREIHRIRITMFRNFAKYLVDFFRFSKIDIAYIKKNIKIENQHYFQEAISRGKGGIALSAHLGNWELGGAVVALLGYSLWVVALPHKHKRVDNFFNAQRESKGLKVIPLGKAVKSCLNVLKENKFVGLVGDRDFAANGVLIDFFGRPVLFPRGPAAFSLKTGATIVPVFLVRNEDDSFTVKIEKPVQFIASGDREKDIMDLIMQYKVIIENYIRKYPEQWYMFRRFWVS
jgi:KDO2-lipid IV(A) lauroyltransferase